MTASSVGMPARANPFLDSSLFKAPNCSMHGSGLVAQSLGQQHSE